MSDMQLMSIGDVARKLGVSSARVRQFEAERRLVPVMRTIGVGIRLYNVDDVNAFVAARAAQPTRRKAAAREPVSA